MEAWRSCREHIKAILHDLNPNTHISAILGGLGTHVSQSLNIIPTSEGTSNGSTSTSVEFILSEGEADFRSSPAFSVLSFPLGALKSLSLDGNLISLIILENFDSRAPPESISTAISMKRRPLKETPSPKPSLSSWWSSMRLWLLGEP